MRNKNHYNEDPTTILTGDIIEPSSAKRIIILLLQDAMLQAVNDYFRALLSQVVPEHAGVLMLLVTFLLICYIDYRSMIRGARRKGEFRENTESN